MQSLLIIGFVWPEPNSSAAGGRMIQLISLYQKQGFKITFASPAQDSAFSTDLESLNVDKKTILLNSSTFDAFIKELNPAVVLFDRFMIEEQFGWRVAENCPNAIRILDTEDLHCLRLARQKAFKENRVYTTQDLVVEEVAKREIASILRCDISLMISQYEIEILTTTFKIDQALLLYLPLLLESEAILNATTTPSFENRSDFTFIGNFLHEPNWNAVQYLKQTIWPLIKKQVPEAVCKIYGAYPSQKVLQLHNAKEGFLILGRAEDAQEVVKQARVVLAPLRFGAGIKGKLLEAMQCGTPSVTTTIGAESMHGDLPWNGFIQDNPELFANQAVLLYQNKKTWLASQENGFETIKLRYARTLFETDFKNQMQSIQKNLEQHRLNNFMGALLQHHTLKSTMYMSKWIAEKNKN
ncbi:glycosyltransferase involved in cell wall biosynthesis [Flavobacterium tiangeerense]|uniref:Glycosyltransferase involved in cell wall biosynthesis n=1 Tax=Flavobacterium tiangeerense TaxID=459471 RepID=A0ABY3FJD8_9FLAO|nr:glycosyltransferase family 4 protein [Flavobacterium tiangeerense]TWH99081.1 glycosyltransferase involved in cell wall biosynthesis [Flavobacterium tiangeerense]